jgi:hypothetical protein
MHLLKDKNSKVRPKLLLLAHAQHGKGTTSEQLEELYGIKCESSSYIATQEFIYDEIKEEFGYKSFAECYEDRVNHRDLYYNKILGYNTPNKARLGELIFSKVDGYDGMRDDTEFLANKSYIQYDFAIWIDASDRKPLEPKSSMKITEDMADCLLDNNGDQLSLPRNLKALMVMLEQNMHPFHVVVDGETHHGLATTQQDGTVRYRIESDDLDLKLNIQNELRIDKPSIIPFFTDRPRFKEAHQSQVVLATLNELTTQENIPAMFYLNKVREASDLPDKVLKDIVKSHVSEQNTTFDSVRAIVFKNRHTELVDNTIKPIESNDIPRNVVNIGSARQR